MGCWWSAYRAWYFTLATLGTAAPWDPTKGHRHRIYSDGNFAFRESEIDGNFDEIEEQLWAIRRKLGLLPVRPRLDPTIHFPK